MAAVPFCVIRARPEAVAIRAESAPVNIGVLAVVGQELVLQLDARVCAEVAPQAVADAQKLALALRSAIAAQLSRERPNDLAGVLAQVSADFGHSVQFSPFGDLRPQHAGPALSEAAVADVLMDRFVRHPRSWPVRGLELTVPADEAEGGAFAIPAPATLN